jgi:hypothetical protein
MNDDITRIMVGVPPALVNVVWPGDLVTITFTNGDGGQTTADYVVERIDNGCFTFRRQETEP